MFSHLSYQFFLLVRPLCTHLTLAVSSGCIVSKLVLTRTSEHTVVELQAAQKMPKARRAKIGEWRRTFQYVNARRLSATKPMGSFQQRASGTELWRAQSGTYRSAGHPVIKHQKSAPSLCARRRPGTRDWFSRCLETHSEPLRIFH